MDDAERRRHTRIRLDGRMVGRATVMADFRVTALSETGAALEMTVPMALGSRCDLSLAMIDLALELKGRVVNVKEPEADGEPYVVGVDFEDMSEVESGMLVSFLDQERRRGS